MPTFTAEGGKKEKKIKKKKPANTYACYVFTRSYSWRKTENRSETNAYLPLETGTYTLSFLFNHVVERVLLMLSVKSWCLKMSSYGMGWE